MLSHLAWGAWIEVVHPSEGPAGRPGRTPHGVRGLKCLSNMQRYLREGRTPNGVRGLKF